MKESRSKYLMKNTAIFMIGNFSSKLITFFLVPLYTNALTTTEYGTTDLITTICHVLTPIIILNISDGVLRYSLDKDADYDKILSIGGLIYVLGIVVGLLIFPINSLFVTTKQYSLYIYLYTVTAAGAQLFLAYLRGREKLGLYTLGNVLQTVCVTVFNILFLLCFKWGVKGYFLAYILSSVVIIGYSLIVSRNFVKIKKFKIDKKMASAMINYSVVLIPNTFMWWIMNSSDRVMVTSMIGVAANGLYAVSYKLPSIVSVVSNIINQAWGYSAVKEDDSKDKDAFSNKMFSLLLAVSVIIAVFLMLIMKPLLSVYVEKSYFSAWEYTPFLLIGNVFLTMGSFLGTSYFVNKNSRGYLYSAISGAVVNIVLNFFLIKYMGVTGAALATCVSYCIVFLYRALDTRKYISIKILSYRNVFSVILLILSGRAMFFSGAVCYSVIGVLLFVECILFRKEILLILNKIMPKFGGHKWKI